MPKINMTIYNKQFAATSNLNPSAEPEMSWVNQVSTTAADALAPFMASCFARPSVDMILIM